MFIVKFFLAALSMLLAGHAVAQGGIIYNHRGPHHNTTLVLPFGQPQVVPVAPVMAPPAGGRIVYACDNGGIPTNVNGEGWCRYGNTLVPGRIVSHEQYGYGHGFRQPYTHAGTAPMINGRCPAGMVSAPRTPEQLPGCW